ncbi:MAG: hypothetical protein ACKVY0_28940 [Prosthecobacter sp.]|uniref:hypothetical protein n=1 Tax=Prosthecobacter sp. TaxID=1965333 RepID=UPI0039011BBD
MKKHVTAFTALLLALGSIQAADKQVQINCKVLSVPLDAPALKEAGLTLDASAGMTNLGIVSVDKVAALLAKLEKSPGVSLLSAPSVTTKERQRTTMESVREFIYPTEFEPAKITNAPEAKPVQLALGQVIAAMPTTPKSFEMRPVGMRIELEASITPEGAISLNMAPELVTFEGFVNYGAPIKAVAADKDGKLQEAVLTENQIQQPLFHRFKSVTAVVLPDTHCVILGGQGGSSGPLPAAGQKPDPAQTANSAQKGTHLVFFIIQAKIVTP